jgi:hypothetical protein
MTTENRCLCGHAEGLTMGHAHHCPNRPMTREEYARKLRDATRDQLITHAWGLRETLRDLVEQRRATRVVCHNSITG